MTLTIGSLFAGCGRLDRGIEAALDRTHAATHCEGCWGCDA